jgi:hypothetical protein
MARRAKPNRRFVLDFVWLQSRLALQIPADSQ